MTSEKLGALRFNSGKPRMSLVPSSLITYTAWVMTYGEQKYAPHNWRRGFKYSSLIDSLDRHLVEFREGKDYDEESGLPHLCHIAFGVAALIEQFDKGTGEDDRFVTGTGKVLRCNAPPKSSFSPTTIDA